MKVYKTYLAGPMQAVSHSGAGWRNKLAKFLKKLNVMIQDPVKMEPQKTRLNAKGTKELLKTLVSLLIRGDKKAEKKFLRVQKIIAMTDFRAIRTSNFIVALVIEGVVSTGTNDELIYAARKKVPVYVLYVGRVENFPAWLLYRVLQSGGRVFPVKQLEDSSDFNDLIGFLKNRFQLEKLESGD